MVEELADRDVRAIRDGVGKPLLEPVVEGEPALGDELQHDRRRERLGDPAHAGTVSDADPPLRLEVANAAGEPGRVAAIAHEDDRPWHAGRDDVVECFLELPAMTVVATSIGRCRRGAGGDRRD